jgi:nucleotide-binding universal stress UspA family protein
VLGKRRYESPEDPGELRAVLLASEAREIPRDAVDLAERLAKQHGVPVYVFSTARVWGTSLGFPAPGLYPNKAEWQKQRDVVGNAVKRLKSRGVRAEGRVIGTRKPAKTIVREADRLGCDAIVMGADDERHPLMADFMWSQEPYRVARRAKIPVYLVSDPGRNGAG